MKRSASVAKPATAWPVMPEKAEHPSPSATAEAEPAHQPRLQTSAGGMLLAAPLDGAFDPFLDAARERNVQGLLFPYDGSGEDPLLPDPGTGA